MPYLLASHRNFYWTLPELSRFDYFSWQTESSGSLLLIGMHLTDDRPWTCARNPVLFSGEPGMTDTESKRILGKRFRSQSPVPASAQASVEIDTIALVNRVVAGTGHSFQEEVQWQPLEKQPGKLLPRHLTAKALVRCDELAFTLHARNFSEISQCLHAELTLMFGLSEILSSLPQPPASIQAFHLETTMKPCKMCAAFLHLVRRRCRNFSVRYEEEDPGPLAARTLLDRFGYQSAE